MKKILLSILLLFTLVACGNLETYHTPSALKKGQKTVRLINFPVDFEGRVTKDLEKKGWDVYAVKSGNQSIEVRLYNLKLDILGYGTGYLKFVDLRTGKEIARYSFKIADPDDVQKKIIDVLESLPGA
ncbi:hypothetical protein LDJ93_08475 [Fusobacterium nucleatum]|jgi:hypothetical protein|uniref:Lipoprotein n=4 Tax=Fusobacterium TaxID=848 RepID=A0ABV3Y7G6_FUSVC|nr:MULTISPECIES: hypothetical protein [Fusobacterium]ALF20483.1 hypothetical protein RN99_08400 [Fusobacterium vincentii ChDC F8]EEO40537.1 hypothetical protein FSCG_01250 [Fusobacterium vincentii 4_1_13]EEU33186.1 hypothetical protein HMPREF0946_01259 [Fusobacterium vincentii 3_1_36A2]EMP17283.1 hypothetical protein H848_00420 [Fusobacterium nucleatum CC53]PIH01942.1 hypothetical protein CS399_05945 [Fusobacterium vincentii]